MERVEDLLRDEFRGDVPVPATRDTMLARVSAVRRRRVAVGAAAAVGVTVAAVGVVATGSLGGGDPQLGTPPAPDRLATVHEVELLGVAFTDHDHGYVMQERCMITFPEGRDMPGGGPTPPTGHDCRGQLVATADAGRTWRERRLPVDPAPYDKQSRVIGRSHLLWVDAPGTIAVAGPDNRYWTSTDGGASWRESPERRKPRPPGSVEVLGADGRPTFVAQPRGEAPISAKRPITGAADGSFWRTCDTGACAMVTRDHGKTWRTVDAPASATSLEWVATADGRTVYAAVTEPAGPRVLRSTNGGGTWSLAARLDGDDSDGEPIPAKPSVTALALPNGDLIVVQGGKGGSTYRLKAGTTTLERLAAAPKTGGTMYRTGGWTVSQSIWDQAEGTNPPLGPVVSLSPDNGTTWQPIPAP